VSTRSLVVLRAKANKVGFSLRYQADFRVGLQRTILTEMESRGQGRAKLFSGVATGRHLHVYEAGPFKGRRKDLE